MYYSALTNLIFGLLLFVPLGPLLAQEQQNRLTEEEVQAHARYIEGLQAFETGESDRALELLNEAYTVLSSHPGVNFALADAWLQKGDLANARYYGKKAAQLDPGNKWYRLKLVTIYRQEGQTEEAIRELEETLKYHPQAGDIILELADSHAMQQNHAESNRLYNRLLNLMGPTPELYLQKLKNFNEAGMQDSAIATLRNIQELEPENLGTLHLLSRYYLQMGERQEAKGVLHEALDRNSRDPKTLIMLSDLLAAESKWDSVTVLLGDIVSDPIVDAQGKMTVAEYMLSQYRRHSSNQILRDATGTLLERFRQAEPDFAPAHALAAEFYTTTRQSEQALEALHTTNELMPSNDEAWRQRLRLLLGQNRTSEAVAVGAAANDHVPQDPYILYYWGYASYLEGDLNTAVERMQQASRLPVRRELKGNIYTSLGDMYAEQDEWEEAYSAYDEALRLNADNAFVLNNYAWYLSLQGERLEEATDMVLRALRLEPQNAAYLDTAGWVFYQREEYEQARRYIQDAIDTGEAGAEVLEHMGDVMKKLGEDDRARDWWERALEEDPSRTYLKDKISHQE